VLVNTEVQCVSTQTSVCVGIVVRVCTSLCVSGSVPSIAFTGLLIESVMGAVVDCEVQCVNNCASGVGLRVVEIIGSGSSVCCAVPIVLFACRHVEGCIIMLVDVEVQGICAGTSVRVGVVE